LLRNAAAKHGFFEELSAMEMKRREFLVRSIAGMSGLLLGPGCVSNAGQNKQTGTYHCSRRHSKYIKQTKLFL